MGISQCICEQLVDSYKMCLTKIIPGGKKKIHMAVRGEFRIEKSTAAKGGNDSYIIFPRDNRYSRRMVNFAVGEAVKHEYDNWNYRDGDLDNSDYQGDHPLSHVNFAENENN